MQGGAQQDMEVPDARVIALMLARCACNNHTICDDELRPIGEPIALTSLGVHELMILYQQLTKWGSLALQDQNASNHIDCQKPKQPGLMNTVACAHQAAWCQLTL